MAAAFAKLRLALDEYAEKYPAGITPNALAPAAGGDDIEWFRREFSGKAFGLDELYAASGSITLPDIHVGYFVHSIAQVRRSLQRGDPRAIAGPRGGTVIPFGSDGGGGWIVMRVDPYPGRVDYLGKGYVADGVHDPVPPLPRELAPDLSTFILRLAADVRAFTREDLNWQYLT